MAQHCAQGYRNIAITAALGEPEAYGPFLRMTGHAHMIFPPAKDEVARAPSGSPHAARRRWRGIYGRPPTPPKICSKDVRRFAEYGRPETGAVHRRPQVLTIF